ncbi:MAG: sulfatase-like hydrolase/transferase [Lentisphaerae bacterium]|jgi:choline-sulfatase|nr:sulfatase-like hydrolase/transferase [Lentisphaerota bacterium]MBT4817222.1 sulfatase-like hydrolase/transferase [Lentisphaerota bacterium]MBT5605551.1 sulfatase-like hydrolase/transferase [Lentisphaerota bacterium]MBT7056828.1 sulfatase-like hydrolase/transferase [Lentisphaerota bacterium]MBT7845386.1 sulfatase-like hydrolase/transferase [Lentisphaerota bacterium]
MPSTDRPNVLIIMSDQHSRHFLGCYGNDIVRTPHLDALAARGMRFESAYCPSPLCVPSRMSFMTGRTPSANRVWSNNDVLSSRIPTWAHSLGAAGYGTALIGRMHFVGEDQRHGFEHRPIGEYFQAHLGAPRLGGPLFKKISGGTSGQCRISVEQAGYGRTTYQAFDDMIGEATCRYLEEKAVDSPDRPFAAVAGFVLPHCPFFAPKDLFDHYYERVDMPVPGDDNPDEKPPAIQRFKKLRGIAEPLPIERIRIARAAYYGMCEYFDRVVGLILAKLTETGLERNTLVIYASDHGEAAGEHGCWWKSHYYEGAVGVPLIAALPGVVPEGHVSNAVCNLMDLGPTVIEMAGADPLPAVDGHSLWTLLRNGEDPAWPNETVSELLGGVGDPPSRMVRSGPWKLFDYDDEHPPVLYNLDEDPHELVDLADVAEFASVRDGLLTRLQDGWDPPFVRRTTLERERDMAPIVQWGKVTHPRHPDVLAIPDVEDVTFV